MKSVLLVIRTGCDGIVSIRANRAIKAHETANLLGAVAGRLAGDPDTETQSYLMQIPAENGDTAISRKIHLLEALKPELKYLVDPGQRAFMAAALDLYLRGETSADKTAMSVAKEMYANVLFAAKVTRCTDILIKTVLPAVFPELLEGVDPV